MTGVVGQIQDHYVDALGTRHHVPPETVEAIRRAMGDPDAGASRDVIVVTEGDEWRGRGEIRLEDGSSMDVDGPPVRTRRRRARTADRRARRMLSAAGSAHVGMGDPVVRRALAA